MAEQQKQQSTQQQTTTQQKTTQSAKTNTKKTTTKPTTSSSSSSSAGKKAAPVLTSAEVDRMIDLGLGRGLDSTDPKPWQNKSAFQVRRVTAESVIGTEEGGSLQSYEREVSSVTTHQTDLKASVVIPQAPVQIGIDAEQSRSVSSTRRAVGKKVINRSISFRSDFDDISYHEGADGDIDAFYWRCDPDSECSVANTQSEFYTFEERLSKWIINRILYRQELKAQEMVAAGSDPGDPKFVLDKATTGIDPLSVISHFIQVSNEEERKQIIHDCYDFVTHFRITHYVSTIELGAAEYRVLSETEYTSRIGAGGAYALETLANLTVTQSSTWKRTKKASDLKRIGMISSDRVGRGTYDEAVVGIRIQPISNLVKLPYLNLALRKSLLHYMDRQGDASSGPFLVSCGGDRQLFWSVDDSNYTVHATPNVKNASLFFVIPNDEGKYPHEFHITYMGDNRQLLTRRVSSLTPMSQRPLEKVSRYLSASVTAFGTNSGPLRLKFRVKGKSRLILESRLGEKGPISPSTWVSGREIFFINCTRRTLKRDGYICVKRHGRREDDHWITACVPSTIYHNEDDIFMLFRLLPPSYREHQGPETSAGLTDDALPEHTDYEHELDEQLERYEKGSAPEEFRAPRQATVKKRLPSDSEDTERLVGESGPLAQVRFDTSGGKMPEGLPLPDLGSHPISDPYTTTRDTTL